MTRVNRLHVWQASNQHANTLNCQQRRVKRQLTLTVVVRSANQRRICLCRGGPDAASASGFTRESWGRHTAVVPLVNPDVQRDVWATPPK